MPLAQFAYQPYYHHFYSHPFLSIVSDIASNMLTTLYFPFQALERRGSATRGRLFTE